MSLVHASLVHANSSLTISSSLHASVYPYTARMTLRSDLPVTNGTPDGTITRTVVPTVLGGDRESWDRVRARAGIYLEKLTDDF